MEECICVVFILTPYVSLSLSESCVPSILSLSTKAVVHRFKNSAIKGTILLLDQLYFLILLNHYYKGPLLSILKIFSGSDLSDFCRIIS